MRWSAVALGVIAASCSSAKLDRVTAGPPRLISPMSGSYITSPDPTLTFELPPGFDHGTIELCTDRDCKNVFETIPATGNTVQAHSS